MFWIFCVRPREVRDWTSFENRIVGLAFTKSIVCVSPENSRGLPFIVVSVTRVPTRAGSEGGLALRSRKERVLEDYQARLNSTDL
jgi:hypothetical protein